MQFLLLIKRVILRLTKKVVHHLPVSLTQWTPTGWSNLQFPTSFKPVFTTVEKNFNPFSGDIGTQWKG